MAQPLAAHVELHAPQDLHLLQLVGSPASLFLFSVQVHFSLHVIKRAFVVIALLQSKGKTNQLQLILLPHTLPKVYLTPLRMHLPVFGTIL